MPELIMKTFSIKVPEKLYDDLAKVAADNDRSQSAEGRRALVAHVKKHNQKLRLTRKGK